MMRLQKLMSAETVVTTTSKSLVMKIEKSILLIDDDKIFIFLTRRLLQGSGKVSGISVCYSAEDAITYLAGKTHEMPDIILLDLNMPEMNGWQFLEAYKQLLPQLQHQPNLFIVSSSIAQNDQERAMQMQGVTGYLAKPLTSEVLETIFR